MERLTNREPAGNAYFQQCFNEPCCGFGCKKDRCEFLESVCDRLAAYEDSGVEPEEIKEHEAAYNECLTRTYGSFKQKISQWLQAEQDGRLVLLPCKVGDTVYFAAWFGTRPHVVKRVIEPYFYTDDAEDNRSGADFSLRDFGRTVFLTREEAEAELAGKGGVK